jgi:cysteine synthase
MGRSIFGGGYKMKVKSVIDFIGNTPMIEIPTLNGKVYAKLEASNPSGSIKDRMALYMINKAEKRGELKPGKRIIEVTSGNTGIAFSMLSANKGYKFMAVMPEGMSIERRRLMKSYGAEIILTTGNDMENAVRKYKELVKEYPDAWFPKQFENTDNFSAYREGLGKEIIKYMKHVDAFVAGIGTGGTLIGVAQALKKKNPNVKIIGVEPYESAVLNGNAAGQHGIQGIGEGFITKIVHEKMKLIDEVITVKSEDAIRMARNLAKQGIMVGISSGANILAATEARKKYKTVVTVLPDRGDRYLSTGMFE